MFNISKFVVVRINNDSELHYLKVARVFISFLKEKESEEEEKENSNDLCL